MSTRANIIFKQYEETLYFYRHSDGYPETAGEDLKEFVKGYTEGKMRNNVSQSAGHLIIRGQRGFLGHEWKVGSYEPTTCIHCDIEYLYVIDLNKRVLEIRECGIGFWDKSTISNTKIIETVKF